MLYREGATQPKMMSVGLHMRLIGHPARAAGLERLLDYVAEARRRVGHPADRHRPALDQDPSLSRQGPQRMTSVILPSLLGVSAS